jgi:hypothetical protein
VCWSSADQNERLGGVLAIDELIDVKVREQHLEHLFTRMFLFHLETKHKALE